MYFVRYVWGRVGTTCKGLEDPEAVHLTDNPQRTLEAPGTQTESHTALFSEPSFSTTLDIISRFQNVCVSYSKVKCRVKQCHKTIQREKVFYLWKYPALIQFTS